MTCPACLDPQDAHTRYGCTAVDPLDGRPCDCSASAEAVAEMVATWDQRPPAMDSVAA